MEKVFKYSGQLPIWELQASEMLSPVVSRFCNSNLTSQITKVMLKHKVQF